jgi:hypothetical protein
MSSEMEADFSFALNAMVKGWQETGVHVWTEKEATLFPAVDQVSYAMGGSATDHVTESYAQTQITAIEAAGQTILSVDDTSDMTALDHIGIQLDDGTLFWSTVASKTSTTVTINDALTDSGRGGQLRLRLHHPHRAAAADHRRAPLQHRRRQRHAARRADLAQRLHGAAAQGPDRHHQPDLVRPAEHDRSPLRVATRRT